MPRLAYSAARIEEFTESSGLLGDLEIYIVRHIPNLMLTFSVPSFYVGYNEYISAQIFSLYVSSY